MDEKHLGETGASINVLVIEPEEAEEFGYQTQSRYDISQHQQSQQQIHWCLKCGLCGHQEEDSAIANENNQKHGGKRNGEPHVL